MSWHHIPKDDAWKQAHLALLAKLGKRAWLHCGVTSEYEVLPQGFAGGMGSIAGSELDLRLF